MESTLDVKKLLSLYEDFPFEHHPLWVAVREGELRKDQIIEAEKQHFIRSDIGRLYRERAAIQSRLIGGELHNLLTMTAREECQTDDSGPSHAEMMRGFLKDNGVSDEEIRSIKSTPGNAAAIALYKDIADRGPLQHMIGAGCVEKYYSEICPAIFDKYVKHYGFKPDSVATYELHGPMDKEHAERALRVAQSRLADELEEEVYMAVRDAFAATSLHYDGMLQAATGEISYWNGR